MELPAQLLLFRRRLPRRGGRHDGHGDLGRDLGLLRPRPRPRPQQQRLRRQKEEEEEQQEQQQRPQQGEEEDEDGKEPQERRALWYNIIVNFFEDCQKSTPNRRCTMGHFYFFSEFEGNGFGPLFGTITAEFEPRKDR